MSMDGARASARRAAASKPTLTCACGRTVRSNAGIASHRKHCEAGLRRDGWPIDAGMSDAIREAYHGTTYRGESVVVAVSRRLGEFYLQRRAAGDTTELPWREYRDLLWKYADEEAARMAAGDLARTR